MNWSLGAGTSPISIDVEPGFEMRLTSVVFTASGATTNDQLMLTATQGGVTQPLWMACTANFGNAADAAVCFALGLGINHPTDAAIAVDALTAALPDVWFSGRIDLAFVMTDLGAAVITGLTYELRPLNSGRRAA